MVYGAEAVLPIESLEETTRNMMTEEENRLILAFEKDTLDETGEKAALKVRRYQESIARHYNQKVRARAFQPRDWVLIRVFQNTKEHGHGKLGANWEGPYQVKRATGRGAYKLTIVNGTKVEHGWNIAHLKRYYFL